MRLWTLHPKYLDTKGLLALWREALLAQKVLLEPAAGYRNHPQLTRFKAQADPEAAITTYLQSVYQEAMCRGYHFTREKIRVQAGAVRMTCTHGQLLYEWEHLQQKLEQRDRLRYEAAAGIAEPEAHPMFDVISGGIENWEVVKNHP